MKPFKAVQPVLYKDESSITILGSCFRLWSPSHYLTAQHVVDSFPEKNIFIMNPFDSSGDFYVKTIHKHLTADIAILKVDPIPDARFEQLKITDSEAKLGQDIHCFGIVWDLFQSRERSQFRVIGGILQRDLLYNDGNYKSEAFELSAPIPKGLSGGPAFLGQQPEIVVGMALATIQSEIQLSSITEIQENGKCFSERISEYTRYGIILRLFPLMDWIKSIIGQES